MTGVEKQVANVIDTDLKHLYNYLDGYRKVHLPSPPSAPRPVPEEWGNPEAFSGTAGSRA